MSDVLLHGCQRPVLQLPQLQRPGTTGLGALPEKTGFFTVGACKVFFLEFPSTVFPLV